MRRVCRTWLPLIGLFLLISALAAMENKPTYPPTRTETVTDRLHGVEVPDPYRWLEDGASKEVKEWVEKQNALTRTLLDDVPGRARIHERLEQLLDIGSLGTPVPVKGRYFGSRRDGKQNQPILYVRDGLRGKDRALIDPNKLSADGTVALDWWYPSRDGRLLAYGLSQGGDERSTLRVRDVDAGTDLPDVVERTQACSLAWTPDGKGFYYTRYPAPGSVPKGEEEYHRHVYFHRLGADPADDPKVFGAGRPAEDWPDVRLSPDGRWLVVTEYVGWTRTDVYFRDLGKDDSSFVPLVEKTDAIFNVVLRDDRFYVHTNDKAPRFRLFLVDPMKPGRADWLEVVPEKKDVLEAVTTVGDTLVGQYMRKASSRLVLFDLAGKPSQEVKLPGLGTVVGLGREPDGDELFFSFQSFTVPTCAYRLDLTSRKGELWERVKADIDPGDYAVEQVTFPSRDQTPITMFLACKKGLERNGKTPTLLYGYGGFSDSQTPTFSASRFLFLERGGLLAVPNLRGGGEHGEAWHQAGMLGNKQNVFDDFLAAAEWLIAQRYTDPERLAIQGGSNGGLLVGAALTQRPERFRAVVCQVPLLDMLRYHKFLIARLWVPEYGSADDAEQFRWLNGYSPYHKVQDGRAYPAVLITAAESDTRVDPLHARKMTARLQAATSSDRPILLRLETKAGHGAGKPRGKALEELTDVWSFLFWQLGMKE